MLRQLASLLAQWKLYLWPSHYVSRLC
jgi:hypothetical protein